MVDVRTGGATDRVWRWRHGYAVRLRVTDTLIVLISVCWAQFLRFGLSESEVSLAKKNDLAFDIGYTAVSVILVTAWLLTLSVYSTRDYRIIGSGTQEYKRVADASLRVFGLMAIIAFIFQIQLARGYLLIALPVGVILLLLGRLAWRAWLKRKRKQGEYIHRVVIIGQREKSRHIAREILRDGDNGMVVVGAVTEHGDRGDLLPGIPVLAGLDNVLDGVDRAEADTVVFSGSDLIGPDGLRQLGWELESRRADLIVAAALTDIAGPRIHSRPVAGLPLIHVDYPEFGGRRYASKRTFDILGAGLALVALSPLFLVLAILVRRDGGPAFFRQQRIGLNGKTFQMLKFRTMIINAEDHLPGLLDQNEGNGILFKMKNDPRITRIGAVLRRYSLDELPQLINVIRGDMSMIGPRPPLAAEVEQYDQRMQRRFLVKPGITGLWQVSGRSNLSWEDSVRLDLYYVENWSLTGDLIILLRTVRAVAASDGAY